MSSDVDNPRTDVYRLYGSLGLLLFSLVLFYALSDFALFYRVVLLLVMIGGAVALLYQTEKGKALWGFFKGARIEVRKVIWPSRQETTQTTLIIFIAVTVAGIFFWVVDSILLWIVKLLTGQGG